MHGVPATTPENFIYNVMRLINDGDTEVLAALSEAVQILTGNPDVEVKAGSTEAVIKLPSEKPRPVTPAPSCDISIHMNSVGSFVSLVVLAKTL